MRSKVMATLAVAVLLTGLAWAVGETLSVQVRTGTLRSRPSFLGRVVGELDYGSQVTVKSRRGAWLEVAAGDRTGWVHESALSEDEVTLRAGDEVAATGTTGEELALAGKGFNQQVEQAYRQEADLDYAWVDRMETWVVAPAEAETFLAAGGVRPVEGGR